MWKYAEQKPSLFRVFSHISAYFHIMGFLGEARGSGIVERNEIEQEQTKVTEGRGRKDRD
jgi:hypothetical protein